MYDSDKDSRVNKFEKRRQNTKLMTILMIVGVLLLIVLLAIWIFGGKDKDTSESDPGSNTTETDNNGNEGSTDRPDDENNTSDNDNNLTNNDDLNDNNQADNEAENEEDENDTENAKNEDVDIKEVESSSDDENVESTYTGNWQPIGTEQSEPHETQFDKSSVDWGEMEEAIRLATGLEEGDMVTWFIGNDGPEKAIGTVTSKDESETYRVYISWITDEGWKPTQVEVLKENDRAS